MCDTLPGRLPRAEPVEESGECEAVGSPVILGGVDKLDEDIVEGLWRTEECENCKQFDKMNIKIMTVVAIEGE